MKLKNYAILLSFLLGGSAFVKAQDIALKSNILYDASGTINLGAEVGLAPRWTLDVSGNYNGWVRSHGRTWKHWMLQPEARYWFCDRFTGHYMPLADMMTFGVSLKLMAFDSSDVIESFKPGNRIGLMPCARSAAASES